MNLEDTQPSQRNWHQQTKLVSAVPPMVGEQVWSGLTQAQQQMVAATIIRICHTLAHQLAKLAESESTTYEHIS